MPVSGQPAQVTYFAVNSASGLRVSNDQANHTLTLIADGVETPVSLTITALTNGRYRVSVPGNLNTGDLMTLDVVSSTPDVECVPANWENDPVFVLPVIPANGGVANFRDQVRRRLGGGDTEDETSGVEVELTDADYITAMTATINLLNRFSPRRNRAMLPNVASDTQRYPISQPGLLDVLDVQFVANTASAAIPDPFDPLINGVMGIANYDTSGTNEYLRYAMALQDARIIFGQDPDWEFEREVANDGTETPVLYVAIPPGVTYSVGYEYSWGITPDDDPRTGVGKVLPQMRDWFYDYGTARAKEILGRKRMKFGGIATAEDGVSEVDGASMLAEAKVELEELEAKLKQRQFSTLPHVG